MRPRGLTLLLVFGLLVLLAAAPARAILVGAGSLESLLRRSDAVVRVRVVSIERPPFERIAFTAQPLAVLKAGASPLPTRMSFTPAQPIWPSDLDLAYRPGAVALLFLEERDSGYAVINNIRAILPALEGEAADANPPLETRVFRELLPVLKGMKTDAGKSRMLNLMSELAPRNSDEVFTPYLKHENEWVRRGALSALLRLNPTAEWVEQANTDFRAFLKSPRRGDVSRFWSLYRLIDTDQAAYLPLFRTLADLGKARLFDDAVVRGLKRGGQKEDALRLYRYTRHRSDYVRHEALDALCRMFKIPLKRPEVTSYDGPLSQAAVEQEARMRSAVTRTLQQEGILKPAGKAKPAPGTARASEKR